ncbi:hypothetical protein G4B88_001311 [Cannabis sativa]|uniref:Uncharacterized protein n=1 Tax=Cannabis sativa TaxID=3483 RepID=A0A7J6I016_CANSA|nr:hypothetical protein G4B88_001311 [Cannabis sativa]
MAKIFTLIGFDTYLFDGNAVILCILPVTNWVLRKECGRWAENALRMFEEMETKDSVSWASVLSVGVMFLSSSTYAVIDRWDDIEKETIVELEQSAEAIWLPSKSMV